MAELVDAATQNPPVVIPWGSSPPPAPKTKPIRSATRMKAHRAAIAGDDVVGDPPNGPPLTPGFQRHPGAIGICWAPVDGLSLENRNCDHAFVEGPVLARGLHRAVIVTQPNFRYRFFRIVTVAFMASSGNGRVLGGEQRKCPRPDYSVTSIASSPGNSKKGSTQAFNLQHDRRFFFKASAGSNRQFAGAGAQSNLSAGYTLCF